MRKSVNLVHFILAILIGVTFFSSPSPSSAQLGMPAPRCDEVLNPDSFYEKYINIPDFKAAHPTYDQWQRLPDDYKNSTVCINENEKTLLMWTFTLPESLSKFQISYKYQVALAVNWDKSAQITHELTPEELIVKAESLPEVDEFMTLFSGELKQSTRWDNYWIGSSSYGVSTGSTSPLQINYVTDKLGSITISNKGLDWADLSIHQNWVNFPTVKIGLDLAKQALQSTNCVLDESPTSISRYAPHSQKNDQEPEEFIYNNYTISCPDNKYRYSMVNIYPDGRFTVWLENREQILSGNITQSDLEKIQAESFKINSTTPTSSPSTTPTENNKLSSKEPADFISFKMLLVVALALCLLGPLVYLLIRHLRKSQKNPPGHEESESVADPTPKDLTP